MALELRQELLGVLSPSLRRRTNAVIVRTIARELNRDAQEVTFFRVPPLAKDAVRLLVRSDVDLSERFVRVPKGKR